MLDIFALDTMAEFLTSPLQFLSYVNRRTLYTEKILASHELVVLAFHLRHNLWIEKSTDYIQLGDDFSGPLDLAMTVRRDGVRGDRDIEGPISHINSTTLGRLLRQIERVALPEVIDLGFTFLTLSGKTVTNLSDQIDALTERTRIDGTSHDITLPMGATGDGLTIHCNALPKDIAAAKLHEHCNLRKYKGEASRWFGICIDPDSGAIRFGITLEFKWRYDPAMEDLVRERFKSGRKIFMANPGSNNAKIGRNEKCPCGSGRKYKYCCLNS